ncbi:MAG: glycosyltransferase [Bacteroidia bacterium]|nr:glycosyltransferase [Bacteroidia bacterium]
MKIVFFATYYDPYLLSFYKSNPNLKNESYDTQLKYLIEDYFGTFGTYTTNANELGHQAHLLIANCEPLQKKWAEENGVVFNYNNWKQTIALEQVKKIKPDVFFIGSMFEYYGSFLDEVRKHVKKIFGWIACAIPKNVFKKTYPELILSSASHLVNNFRDNGIKSELLNACFDKNIFEIIQKRNFKKLNTQQTELDFTFIGGITLAHKKRIDDLTTISKKTPISLFGYGYKELNKQQNIFKRFFLKNELINHYKGDVWGLNMFEKLYESKITFNSHIDIAKGFGVNMRMYEATGMGTLLLTDGKGKNQLFDDTEVVYYSNINDAIEKVNYYLSHEKERREIAKAGQIKTLEKYNSLKNVSLMMNYFEDNLKYKS